MNSSQWVLGFLLGFGMAGAGAQRLYYVDSSGNPVLIEARREGNVLVVPHREQLTVDGAQVDGEQLTFKAAKAMAGYVDGRRVVLHWGDPARVITAALDNARGELALARRRAAALPARNAAGDGTGPASGAVGHDASAPVPDAAGGPDAKSGRATTGGMVTFDVPGTMGQKAGQPVGQTAIQAALQQPAKPSAKPEPAWEIRISDGRIADALERWARESHGQFALRWDAGVHFPIQAGATFRGPWDVAVTRVLESMVAARPDQALRGCIFEANSPVLMLITSGDCGSDGKGEAK